MLAMLSDKNVVFGLLTDDSNDKSQLLPTKHLHYGSGKLRFQIIAVNFACCKISLVYCKMEV